MGVRVCGCASVGVGAYWGSNRERLTDRPIDPYIHTPLTTQHTNITATAPTNANNPVGPVPDSVGTIFVRWLCVAKEVRFFPTCGLHYITRIRVYGDGEGTYVYYTHTCMGRERELCFIYYHVYVCMGREGEGIIIDSFIITNQTNPPPPTPPPKKKTGGGAGRVEVLPAGQRRPGAPAPPALGPPRAVPVGGMCVGVG